MAEFAALGMVPASTLRLEILKTFQVWTAYMLLRYCQILAVLALKYMFMS